jgi:hypothetical protein
MNDNEWQYLVSQWRPDVVREDTILTTDGFAIHRRALEHLANLDGVTLTIDVPKPQYEAEHNSYGNWGVWDNNLNWWCTGPDPKYTREDMEKVCDILNK